MCASRLLLLSFLLLPAAAALAPAAGGIRQARPIHPENIRMAARATKKVYDAGARRQQAEGWRRRAMKQLAKKPTSAKLATDSAPSTTGVRWIAVQGGVDIFSALFLVGFRLLAGRDGATLVDVINDPTTKFFVFGPAFLAFGIIGQRTLGDTTAFATEPKARAAFESDPIVQAMGGPDAVRSLKVYLDDLLTVKAKKP